MVVVVGVVAVIASMALPSYQERLARAKRAEAISALQKLQLAQEAFRAQHGSYALSLRSLPPLAADLRHHDIMLAAAHADGYTARTQARSAMVMNQGCGELTLTVQDGLARQGPRDDCWSH
jgi:type IV pilus assembly protein PilE